MFRLTEMNILHYWQFFLFT